MDYKKDFNLDERAIVLVITMIASFATWKMVKDFYSKKLHKLFAHIIAVLTATFMFLSTMILFVPQDYQRGATAEVEISVFAIALVCLMVAIVYLFFKYIPSRKK